MRAGIIGYPFVGKTTLYRAASGGKVSGDLASVPVADARFDKLCEAVQPKKRTPATVEIQDDAAPLPGPGRAKPGEFSEAARKFDVLIHVLREFENPTVPHYDSTNIVRDHNAVTSELIVADLQLIENRLEKLARSQDAKSPGKRDYMERVLFEKIAPMLESGTPVRKIDLIEDEQEIIEFYRFLTSKPLVTAINCSEDNIHSPTELEAELNAQNEPVFRLCASIEQEISEMEPDDRPSFFADLKIERPASENLIRAVYQALGLITFFTAGQNDTRAWPLRLGSTALKAAGTIHTDIARGFIRAEVVHYSDFDKLDNVKACYDQNLMKLEGKEYVVVDGDILNIRNKT